MCDCSDTFFFGENVDQQRLIIYAELLSHYTTSNPPPVRVLMF